ncbi:MAG: type II toxin-antitoxin system HicA family toxin [Treponema sp.]|jgi:predicted RNA binding protein YcfA (HicA-like mRNA interferase family)|nr:type II toxin-antitoxin system HicA family toxin [Treponema sp.]
MTMTGKEMVKLLKKHGWILDHIQGSHHIMLKDNLLKISVPVHKNKDLKPGILHSILKEAGLE